MSGIAGIIRWDGQESPTGLLHQMAERIKHRGGDGVEFLEQDNVALVFLHLAVTPESIYEVQPLSNRANIVLVCDARLDNRSELLELLNIETNVNDIPVPDSRLILAAYEMWQADCLDYLIGDFSFVIWNSLTQTVFCGRDHSGVRPFYYHYVPGRYFLFASEIKALWEFKNLKKEIDDNRVANYLLHWGQFNIYQHNTFFKGVSSLPPAHRLLANKQGITTEMYWKIDPQSYQYSSEEEYVAAFKKIFLEAVRCRIRTPFPVSSFLSGGLDSSSVAAVASTQLVDEGRTLATYYIDTQLAETSEREYVLPFLEKHPVQHSETVAEEDYYGHLEAVARVTDMPEMFSVTYNHFTPILRDVQHRGSRVLLTGSDGDTVVGYGMEYIFDAIREGNWTEGARRLKQAHDPLVYRRLYGEKDWKEIYSRSMVGILRGQLPALFGRFGKHWQFLKGALLYMRLSPFQLLRILIQKFTDRSSTDYSVEPALSAHRVPFIKEGSNQHSTTNLLINRGMLYQMMSEVSEYYDIIGAHHQVQIVHPFFDKRLIELCMFMPSKLKFYEGYGRGPLRAAMKDYLPEKILKRKGKIDFTPYMNKQLADQVPSPFQTVAENEDLLAGYINTVNAPSEGQANPETGWQRLHHRILYFLHWRKAQGI